MHVTQVISEKCSGCEDCLFVCTIRALRIDDGHAVVGDNCNDCKDCWNRCPEGAISHGDASSAVAAADTPVTADWRGVLVWLRADGAQLDPHSREMLSAARQLADNLGVYVEACLHGSVESGQDAVAHGADKVHVASGTEDAAGLARLEPALLSLIRQRRFEIVLFPEGEAASELAPRLAQKLETVVLPPVESLDVDSETRDLSARTRLFGGRFLCDVTTSGSRPQFAIVRRHAFPEASADRFREGEILPPEA
ncbi:MAG: hypothetical protein HY814_11205 [Candidatus Riflebacteria bacterium]|nr:hypothetical protein [Candidatus Riflebacteria bacterium]